MLWVTRHVPHGFIATVVDTSVLQAGITPTTAASVLQVAGGIKCFVLGGNPRKVKDVVVFSRFRDLALRAARTCHCALRNLELHRSSSHKVFEA